MFTILFPMFALSGVLAYLLYRELDKEEKKKEKKGEEQCVLAYPGVLFLYFCNQH